METEAPRVAPPSTVAVGTSGVGCALCGLPVAPQPLLADGHPFCCHGCRQVYQTFGLTALQNAGAPREPQTDPAAAGAEVFLRVDGMHCSSCEILINRMAEHVPGILHAQSSYATSSARIVYDPAIIDEAQLPQAISATGYRARLISEAAPVYDGRLDLLRLLTGVALAGLVMMLYVALYYPVHLGIVDAAELAPIRWLTHSVAPWVIAFLTAILLIYVAAPIFRGAWIGLRARVLNMDNLLAIALLAAYGYSIGSLISGSLDLYFDVAATIVAVVTIGRHIERNAKKEATRALSEVMEKWGPKARIRWGGDYRLVGLEDLTAGELVLVWQGEAVPVDGTIVYGQAAVDESLMTGEPFPVSRTPGEPVLGGSLVVEGQLEIQVGERVESRMDNLARILWNVQSATRGAQGLADRVARAFVPLVLLMAALITGISLIAGAPPTEALMTGLATLIVSCPCTFGLAIPLTTAIGVSEALKRGIIITSADAFEKTPSIDVVALDRTGTLSTGDMAVTGIWGEDQDKIAAMAAAVERLSPHPIARAIARLDDSLTAESFEAHPGKGALAVVDGQRVAVGSRALFASLGWPVDDIADLPTASSETKGSVISFVGWDGRARGGIATRDTARPEWERVVRDLRRHCRVVLLTGAEHPVGYEHLVDQVFAGVPPEGKAAVIRQLQQDGHVVMVGDGSNDAPALAAAHLGIAFGAPTGLAAEAADVVIPGQRLDRLFNAFDLIFTVRRRVRQSLGWALLYNAIAIPIALAGLLNPLFAAIAMSTSSLLVVWNAARPIRTGNR